MSKGEPDHNFDVTEDSGYQTEGKVQQRFGNGWGGTKTRLPPGHLARRDSGSDTKHAKAGGGDDGD